MASVPNTSPAELSAGGTTAPLTAAPKFTMQGSITLGNLLELRQRAPARSNTRFRINAAMPTDGILSSVDIANPLTRPAGAPGEQLTWDLEKTDGTLEIKNKGLTESYMIFGVPGSGKTYLLMYLLKQMFELNSEDAGTKAGALILDPKGELYEQTRDMLAKAGRLDDFVYLDAAALAGEGRGVNIIDAGLDPAELGALLVQAGRSAGAEAEEPFWFGLWTTLFRSAVPLLAWRDEQVVTLESLTSALLDDEEDDGVGTPKRRIQRIAADAKAVLDQLPPDERRDMKIAINGVESFFRHEARSTETVDTLMRKAFGGFQLSKWRPLSAATPNVRGARRVSFYDRIIEEGKIVLMSVGDDKDMGTIICTIVKVIFQRTVLGRADRVRKGTLSNFKRPVVLAVDEYAAVASEIEGQPVGDGLFLSQCRAAGCIGLLAVQSVNLLRKSPLKDNWKAITSVCTGKIFMRLADNETAEEATKLAGEFDWYLTSDGTSQQKDGGGTSTNTELRERKALPAAILTQTLKMGQAAMVGSVDGKETTDTLRFFQCPRWA